MLSGGVDFQERWQKSFLFLFFFFLCSMKIALTAEAFHSYNLQMQYESHQSPSQHNPSFGFKLCYEECCLLEASSSPSERETSCYESCSPAKKNPVCELKQWVINSESKLMARLNGSKCLYKVISKCAYLEMAENEGPSALCAALPLGKDTGMSRELFGWPAV